MGLALVVYNLTLVLSVLFAWLANVVKKRLVSRFFLFAGLCIIIFVSVFRGLEVGTDNSTYAQYYNDLDPSFDVWSNIILNVGVFEPGYIVLNYFLKLNGTSYIFVSFIYSLIIWYLVLKSFKRQKEILYLAIFLFITTGFLFFTFNGIRQAIAMSAVFFSIPLVIEKKYFKFSLCIIAAALFHISVLLMLSLIFISKIKKWKTTFWGTLFVISIFIPGKLLYGIIGKVAFLFPFYGSYLGREDFNSSYTLTTGVIYQMMLGFILLYYYHEVARSKIQVLYFHLFFIGQILYNFFYANPFINRFLVYFLFFEVYAFAFTIHFLIQRKRSAETFLILISFFLVFTYKIVVGESGASPFSFNFR